MKQIGIGIVFLFLAFSSSAQQLTQYSQWFLHHFAINPAHAGIKECVDVHTLYRSQWLGFDGAPNSGFLTVAVPLSVRRRSAFSARHGTGFRFATDRIGQFSINRINLAYAGHFNFNQNDRLSLGIYGGVLQTGYDPGTSVTADPDPSVMQQANFLSPDASIGAWFNSKNYYFGLILRNLFPSRWEDIGVESQYRMHTSLNAGYRLPLKEKLTFLPNMMVRIPPRSKISADFNAYVDYNNTFGFGLGFRTGDAVNAIVTLKIKQQFSISYSFDYTISSIQTVSNNTHELSLRFTGCKSRRSGPADCPLFE